MNLSICLFSGRFSLHSYFLLQTNYSQFQKGAEKAKKKHTLMMLALKQFCARRFVLNFVKKYQISKGTKQKIGCCVYMQAVFE